MKDPNNKKDAELAELRQRRIVELEKESSVRRKIGELHARLAAIVEFSNDAIIGKDLDGIITSWNKGAERIYGYTASEAIGRPVAMLSPPSHMNEVPDILDKIRRGENIGHYETVRVRKDGTQINISLAISPINDGSGNVVGASTIARDITERKKAEEIIWRQAQTLNQIQDSVITTDRDGIVIGWNKGAERMLSYALEEVVGRHVSFIYPEDQYEFLKQEFKGPLREKGEYKTEVRLRRKTGEEFHALLFLTLLRDENGAVLGTISSSVDITERMQAEEKIRLAKEEWEKTFDAIPDMVAVIDRQHIITRVNRAMAEKLGMGREDLIGKPCYRMMHGKEEPPSYCPHNMTLVDGKEHIRQVYDENLKGHYLISATPIYAPGGDMAGIVQVSRDISGQKKMEEKLREAAVTDVLTGLFNRRGFFRLAQQQLNLAGRKERSMMLLYLDMNNMKEINDKFGHKEGDQALIDTAKLLRKSFRESDIIARMGGDEFAVLLTEPSGPDVGHIISGHIQHNLENHNKLGGCRYRLSISLGIAYYDPQRPCSLSELLSVADVGMYRGKKQYQRNRDIDLSIECEKRLHDRSIADDRWWAEIEGLGRAGIINISPGGICLKTAEEVGVRNKYGILVHSPDNRDMRHEGVAVWSRQTGWDKESSGNVLRFESGIQFVGLRDSKDH